LEISKKNFRNSISSIKAEITAGKIEVRKTQTNYSFHLKNSSQDLLPSQEKILSYLYQNLMPHPSAGEKCEKRK
jgi:hypothetical protein